MLELVGDGVRTSAGNCMFLPPRWVRCCELAPARLQLWRPWRTGSLSILSLTKKCWWEITSRSIGCFLWDTKHSQDALAPIQSILMYCNQINQELLARWLGHKPSVGETMSRRWWGTFCITIDQHSAVNPQILRIARSSLFKKCRSSATAGMWATLQRRQVQHQQT